jgi:hypothetical protein
VIEVDWCQQAKSGQHISGDVFLCRKLPGAGRVVSILADGLGSGVEAATLAALTSSMAIEYVASDLDLRRSAEIVMDVLPIDRDRQISYATFTVVDTGADGQVEVVSHAGPHFVLLREGRRVELAAQRLHRERWSDRELHYWRFPVRLGDRLVLLSDGVTQAGLGSPAHPLGWGEEGVEGYLVGLLGAEPGISARQLSRRVVREAICRDGRRAGDDVSCAVVYFREPRRMMVFSGPPYAETRDRECAERLRDFDGARVVCGGTTANIVARELGLEVTMDLRAVDPEVPATSAMPGIDLVTEGMLTLGKVAEILETRAPCARQNGATKLAELLLDHDRIELVVGTRVNEAHQDPSLPVELDIRRNVIRRIARALDETYLKQVSVEFI